MKFFCRIFLIAILFNGCGHKGAPIYVDKQSTKIK
jgi:hypothetical protein